MQHSVDFQMSEVTDCPYIFMQVRLPRLLIFLSSHVCAVCSIACLKTTLVSKLFATRQEQANFQKQDRSPRTLHHSVVKNPQDPTNWGDHS